MEEILYASLGVVPELLVAGCLIGRPLRSFGAVAWFALLRVMGSDVGVCLPLGRDRRLFGRSAGRSNGVVGGGGCRLVFPCFGTFRPANAGCFFGKSALIPFAAQ